MMVIKSGFDVDEVVKDDRVHGSIYTDPAIFGLEMERIFYRTWVYVAHESEIAQGGDYKSTYIGQQPVLVTRNADDGQIYVLYNRCRHRAATVCQQACGNANYFRCAYHGWTYNNRGDLVGVTYRQGYGPDFNYGEMGLTRVARVATHAGFIFASMAPTGPSLAEHLGNAASYLEQINGQGPEGIKLTAGAQRYGYNGNWKIQLENTVDNYHAGFVHQSFFDILGRRMGGKRVDVSGNPAFRTRDLGNGHAILDFVSQSAGRLGDLSFNLSLFPNLMFVGIQIRVLFPRSVTRTDVQLYPSLLKGVSDEQNGARLRNHEAAFGPAGLLGPDDVEVAMQRVADGMAAHGDDWLILSRGLPQEQEDEKGVRSSIITGETTQRAIYRRWHKEMAVA